MTEIQTSAKNKLTSFGDSAFKGIIVVLMFIITIAEFFDEIKDYAAFFHQGTPAYDIIRIALILIILLQAYLYHLHGTKDLGILSNFFGGIIDKEIKGFELSYKTPFFIILFFISFAGPILAIAFNHLLYFFLLIIFNEIIDICFVSIGIRKIDYLINLSENTKYIGSCDHQSINILKGYFNFSSSIRRILPKLLLSIIILIIYILNLTYEQFFLEITGSSIQALGLDSTTNIYLGFMIITISIPEIVIYRWRIKRDKDLNTIQIKKNNQPFSVNYLINIWKFFTDQK